MEECDEIMVKIREDQHQKILEMQKAKIGPAHVQGRACKQRWPLKHAKIHG